MATNTFFLENKPKFFSTALSFSSRSSFLFCKAIVFIEIGILSNSDWISFLLCSNSDSICYLSDSCINLVPGGQSFLCYSSLSLHNVTLSYEYFLQVLLDLLLMVFIIFNISRHLPIVLMLVSNGWLHLCFLPHTLHWHSSPLSCHSLFRTLHIKVQISR